MSCASGDSAADLSPENLDAARQWLRAPLIDCGISFLVVVIFSAVFVASGTIVLGPQQQIPGDGGFLEHQAQFVTNLHPWLYPLYVAGTLLTMFGTLYGTLEVAPPVVSECYRLLRTRAENDMTTGHVRRLVNSLEQHRRHDRSGRRVCLPMHVRRQSPTRAYRACSRLPVCSRACFLVASFVC